MEMEIGGVEGASKPTTGVGRIPGQQSLLTIQRGEGWVGEGRAMKFMADEARLLVEPTLGGNHLSMAITQG